MKRRLAGAAVYVLGTALALQRRQHRFRAGHLEGAGLLDVEALHHTVLHHHGEALRAGAEADAGSVELEAERLGEGGVAVGQQLHLLANLLIPRSEEHTSELQSLMRISYAVFC